MAINWNDVKSRSIRDAFRVALSDDKQLSHAEVVEVLRSAMKDGYLSEKEIDDLQVIANTSETIMGRSKAMLLYLRKAADLVYGYGPIIVATGRQKYAADLIFNFMKRMGQIYFPKLDRDEVGIDLLLRVSNPNILNQRSAGICGPMGFLYSLAFDSPAAYAKYAIDLYENGKAMLGHLKIDPSSDCRQYSPPRPMSPADWLTGASLRDSENFWFNYSSMGDDDSGTRLNEMAQWFEKAGYTDVHCENNLFYNLKMNDIEVVNRYYNAGYRTVLRINSKLLKAETQNEKSKKGNHVVILRSPISIIGNAISLKVYTWAEILRPIPAPNTQMSPSGFLEHWYGYVVARPY
ncbi:hypothetical protein GGD65_006955 [Bradyrhizobium sp. CIR18]|uniref:hypothetical protein n=1 Tax=unclassified Bradyrhizobium TaxID=2631580 RepID=UPI000370EE8E|nr:MULTISPECIES: hypothetical protein [unclassified Bradyrhizobium]MBB4365886.1 hypothetical protein [Bradyrhizobium sp. CIR18]